MEINLNELNTQEATTTTNEKKMRLSENASSFIFQMFTKNVYSNPIGTVVREITSNCFDSHIEAGVNKPVLIKKTKDSHSDMYYISFIDYGIGMSPDRVENIYGVYFESTKRTTNNQIGGFGIGAKSVLAYKRSTGIGEGEYDNSFYVITKFNGVKYHYCIYEGAETPVISLLHQENTNDDNGTEVRIPVLQKDLSKFEHEMTRQLYYFENIIFEGFDSVDNNYQIISGENFWYRGTRYDNCIHICLGRVAYPIDYNALGLNKFEHEIPIAIKLNVGDINVTVSRESLDYSEKTIQLLKNKLKVVVDEVKQLLINQVSNVVELEDWFKSRKNMNTLFLTNDKSLYVGNVVKLEDADFKNFKYGMFNKIPNDNELFGLFFKEKQFGKIKRSMYRNNGLKTSYKELINAENIYFVEDVFNRKVLKQSYLNYLHDTFHLVQKRDLINNKYRIENLFGIDTKNGKDLQLVAEMQEDYFNIIRKIGNDYDKVIVSDDFMEMRKNRKKEKNSDKNIPVRFNGGGTRFNVKLEDLYKFRGAIFYGCTDDEFSLEIASRIVLNVFNIPIGTGYANYYYNDLLYNFTMSEESTKKGVLFIQISKTNYKYMKYCRKAMHVDDFYKKYVKRRRDIVQTHFQSKSSINRYNELNHLYKTNSFDLLNKKWGKVVNDAIEMYDDIKDNTLSNINYIEETIKKVFNINDTQPKNSKIKKFEKLIDRLEKLQNNNNEIIDYIRLFNETNLNESKDTLIKILKKVMVF